MVISESDPRFVLSKSVADFWYGKFSKLDSTYKIIRKLLRIEFKIFREIPNKNNILQESAAKIIDDEECLSLDIENIEADYGEMSDEKFEAIAEIEEEMSKFRYCLKGLDNSHLQRVKI